MGDFTPRINPPAVLTILSSKGSLFHCFTARSSDASIKRVKLPDRLSILYVHQRKKVLRNSEVEMLDLVLDCRSGYYST
jgi:hypothetical protein